ncbi:heterokaryon incompatibility protein-domain-containing protein [Podospora didyma]|uniref:Heterokaryon incompatibility protein-domain-containing protein n=1 Tax=Podospora didyma TaxID=330526 RepID=A0AAE0U1X8_9PEZI|nr:heterokaryon incompatibility protein-domain-containing protein [Podospora didyma]
MAPAKPSDRLCHVCKSIDFNKHVKTSIEQLWKAWQWFSASKPSERLGTWRNIQRRTLCPFCRLVVECVDGLAASTGGRPGPDDVIELSNRPSWKTSIVIFNFNGSESKVYSNRADLEDEARAVRLRGDDEAQKLLITWENCLARGEIQCLADRNRPGGDTFFGRAVRAREPNWSLLQWWLRHCSRCHGELCQPAAANLSSVSLTLPANMRVIDVEENSVVKYRSGWEYVALTYVWGEKLMDWPMPTMTKEMLAKHKEAVDEEKAQGSVLLPSWLPKTVSDAIEATKRLGYRYLWVDAMCIVQDDDEDRHSQVLHMDSIYRNASLSIAAASGSHADCGLPGMSVPRRFRQKRESVKGLTLAIPLPRFDELNAGDNLRWNTRAWTFQEKALSRRLLIFTDYQAYFRCPNGVWAEDTAAETTRLTRPDGSEFFRWGNDKLPHDYSTRRPYSLVDFLSFGYLELARMDARASFANYAAVVGEYTQRTLTFPRDALPAIDGVLRVLNRSPNAYVAGLPRGFFLEAILWQPKLGSLCVEGAGAGAPSWSWASWSLPGGCAWQTRDVRDTKSISYLYDMFYWTSNSGASANSAAGALGPLPIALQASNRTADIPPNGPCIGGYLQQSGTLLGLWTGLGYLALGRPMHSISSEEETSDNTVAAFPLLHPDQHTVVGEVITTLGMRKWKKTNQYEFVDISRGAGLCFVSKAIPENLRPTTTTTSYIPATEASFTREGYYLSGTEADLKTKIKRDPEHTWGVANVMMVERRVDGVAYRRGIGKVLKRVWEEGISTRTEFVYIA